VCADSVTLVAAATVIQTTHIVDLSSFSFYFLNICTPIAAPVAGERIVCDLREKLFSKYVRSDVSQVSMSSSGEMLSRIQRDTGDLQQVLTKDLPQLITGAVETIIGFVILFHICAPLARWVIIALPLSVCSAVLYGRISAAYSRALSAALASSSDVANEQLTGIRVVKSFAAEELSEHKYNSTVRSVLGYGTKVAVADGIMQSWNRAIFSIKNVIILWLGSKFVALGTLSIGSLLAFAFYCGNLTAALSKLGVSTCHIHSQTCQIILPPTCPVTSICSIETNPSLCVLFLQLTTVYIWIIFG
jgi:ABC-type multidrug transport system fused ATPase/permease subunit